MLAPKWSHGAFLFSRHKYARKHLYSPSRGSVTSQQFAAAVREFKRTNEPVLIARKVNIYQWQTSGINEMMGNVFVNAKFEDDVLKSSTFGDLWIVKCQDPPHEIASGDLIWQLRQYCQQFQDLLSVGGGNMNLNGCTCRADTAVRIRSEVTNGQSNLPRVLVEVEFENRTVGEAYKFILGYFTLISSLQSVIFFAFYPKRKEDGTFAAVAIHYRRGAGGVVIEDAVSFGSAEISRSAYYYYPAELKAFGIRRLPLAPNGSDIFKRNPWSPADRAFIRIPGGDLFFLQPPGVLVAGAPVPAPNCEISLWQLLQSLSGYQW
jgi:hypothetical protein